MTDEEKYEQGLRWARISKHLSEGERLRIENILASLGYCLRFENGKIWLDLRANGVLAYALYGATEKGRKGG